MMFQPMQPWIITLSVHIYRWLIRRFPEEFRDEYGEVTLQDFRHCCHRAYEQRGVWSVLQLWPSMFTGAVVDMGAERLSEVAHQRKLKWKDKGEELQLLFLMKEVRTKIADLKPRRIEVPEDDM